MWGASSVEWRIAHFGAYGKQPVAYGKHADAVTEVWLAGCFRLYVVVSGEAWSSAASGLEAAVLELQRQMRELVGKNAALEQEVQVSFRQVTQTLPWLNW